MAVKTGKSWPFLTEQFAGVGGVIKSRPEDFRVEEVPRYEPSGSGTHVYAQIEKKGCGTVDALARIARALHITRKQIGYAGLKDARAVTRQWISVEHIDPDRLARLDLPSIRVLRTARHSNKIKLGHLAGNRFAIRIRELQQPLDEALGRTEAIMEVLMRRGVPNYFGRQRFGNRFDSHLLGGAIIRGNSEQFIDLFLGLPDPADLSVVYVVRSYYEQGRYQEAYDAWPGHFHDQRRALRALIRGVGQSSSASAEAKRRAYNVIDRLSKRFFVSAFQSDLFNQVVAARMGDIDRVWPGDLAYKHDSGACFVVEDAELEQSRCDALEISPSGPLFGYRMTQPEGRAGEMEAAILEQAELEPQDFRRMTLYKVKGARRSLRCVPRRVDMSCGADEHGPYVEVKFELDSGCYATSVLREITKNA